MMVKIEKEYNGSESDESEEDEIEQQERGPNPKRRRFSDDERLKRCRERNKIHARNTRERKRMQMETLQQTIQDLIDEKVRLTSLIPDASIASILMSLNQPSANGTGLSKTSSEADLNGAENNNKHEEIAALSQALMHQESELSKEARRRANLTIEKLRLQVSALLNVDEELDVNHMSPNNANVCTEKDRSKFSKSELSQIRRERNRLHAKKTRLKKKKMLAEMELIISGLQDEVKVLKAEMAHCNPNLSNPNLLLSCNNAPFMLSVNTSSNNLSSAGSQYRSLYSAQSNSSSTQSFAASFPSSFYSNHNNTSSNSNNDLYAQESLLFSQFADIARHNSSNNGDLDSDKYPNPTATMSSEEQQDLLNRVLQQHHLQQQRQGEGKDLKRPAHDNHHIKADNTNTSNESHLRDGASDLNGGDSTGTESSDHHHHRSTNETTSDSGKSDEQSRKRAKGSWSHPSFDMTSMSDITSQAGSGSSSSSKNSGRECEVGERGSSRDRSDSSARSTTSGCTHSECSRSPPPSPKRENTTNEIKAGDKAILMKNTPSMASLEYKKYMQRNDHQFIHGIDKNHPLV
mmetsp:Transcript_28186/g.38765  ORF Transcript_28186/g.38765 Transcript_28186/m.38765 type:complete len:576 (-) Transcript_28186:130-1857(-)